MRRILHRDISAGNVLIMRDAEGKARGLLIDWDLCYVDGYAKADEKRWITVSYLWDFLAAACWYSIVLGYLAIHVKFGKN